MRNEENIVAVFGAFNHQATLKCIQEFSSGHINDTYLIETEQERDFVLQRINGEVFKNIPALVENKVKISKHLLSKLPVMADCEKYRRVLSFVPAVNGSYHHRDVNGQYWNLSYYIPKSISFDTVTEKEVAYEGGKLFGNFINQTSDFDASELVEVIPGFHDMNCRLVQFENAKEKATQERLKKARTCIESIYELKEEMLILQNLKDKGKIAVRVTHNDTKISNALFNQQNKGLCVIDTDTVMPGIVHNDFGDAIRTICNTAEEDEKDLSLVSFNVPYYKAYFKGFLEELRFSLSPLEKEHLPLGAKTIIYIMALRFLTDYLNGDVYYKTNYDDHNLNRSKNQLKLIDSFEEQYDQILEISNDIIKLKEA
ncbi:phosphotransferase enzyme family protein [Zobellia alginiliquefaciens]|uniref:phosphotransferase enzyme family protein n=1 Tax=Zobellia alginiliquefaciens TaxID=3032586 RepID=UPI0023E3A7F7|nr:aminoglycoside phosphotransferase family protein [Zobellia alginiliquefaciens]